MKDQGRALGRGQKSQSPYDLVSVLQHVPCCFLSIVGSDLSYDDSKEPALFSLLASQMVEEPVSSNGDQPGDRVGSSVVRLATAQCIQERELGQLLRQACITATPSEQVGVHAPGRDVVPRPELALVGEDRLELRSALQAPLLRTPSRFHLFSRSDG